jgi:hypothetical protein
VTLRSWLSIACDADWVVASDTQDGAAHNGVAKASSLLKVTSKEPA